MNVELLNHNYASNEFEARLADIIRVSYGKTPSLTADCERDATKDRATIRNCFNAGHMSVFEFVDATVFIECPIYVARQLMRYRCASYIEMSLRRCKPIGMSAPVDEEGTVKDGIADYCKSVDIAYHMLLELGAKKEQARAILPLGTWTQFCMKTNMREWYHIFNERLDPSAQRETREVVGAIKDALAAVYPFLIEIWADARAKVEAVEKDEDK